MSARCNEFEASGTIARYVAGNLDEAAAEDFENHYLTCVRCQTTVRAGAALRGSDISRATGTRTRRVMIGAAITVAAASFAGISLWRGGDTRMLRDLGRVDVAPLYLGSPVRAADSRDAVLFDSAMTLYGARRYQDAARVLESARASSNDVPALNFFLGASHLLAGAPERAAAAFGVVIDAGESLYLTEAYLYRAKAQLQQGRRSAALADLRTAGQRGGAAGESAQQLLEQLEQ